MANRGWSPPKASLDIMPDVTSLPLIDSEEFCPGAKPITRFQNLLVLRPLLIVKNRKSLDRSLRFRRDLQASRQAAKSNSRLQGHQRYVQRMSIPQSSPSVAMPQPPSPSVAIKMLLAKPLVKIKLLFMVASFISLVLSVSLYFNGHEQQGIYVGIWVPSILSLGSLLLAGERGE
jgi:hypothetical protein